jgi:hypothetical protein
MSKRAKKNGLLLRASGEQDGFSTLDLLSGTSGVCEAIDQLAGEYDPDLIHRLGMAAKILSGMLRARVEF